MLQSEFEKLRETIVKELTLEMGRYVPGLPLDNRLLSVLPDLPGRVSKYAC